MAKLCDVFIMDAFAVAHRAQASTVGIAEYAPVAAAGPLLVKELTALNKVLTNPKRPCAAIVGGAKVSSVPIGLRRWLRLRRAGHRCHASERIVQFAGA